MVIDRALYVVAAGCVDRVVYAATTQLVQHPENGYQTMRRQSPFSDSEYLANELLEHLVELICSQVDYCCVRH